ILSENTVETKRGCEVLCDKLLEVIHLLGLQSPCSLLGAANQSEICSLPMMIYSKQTTGCPARSDFPPYHDFGVDPCVDDIFPNVTRTGVNPVCPRDSTMNYIIRYVIE
ncbi:hypothetical protein PFISCL1PPCAC_18744, partial [Pristionchus fissidentatus]